MNDRMTELYAKACLDARDIHPTDVPAFIACMAGNLAKLIVEECIGCCEQVISDPVPKSVDTWLNGGSQCIDQIKQHFGVEE